MSKNVLITGSAGHLGEALMRTHRTRGDEAVGLDVKASPFTTHQGDIGNRELLAQCLAGVQVVYHTATLHKPHVATHSKQQFVDTNVAGTLALLEAAVDAGVKTFVFTSTTSVFGDAMRPQPGEGAVWVTEALTPVPKNIYGVTKLAAENLCQLFQRNHGLNVIVLRTSRFFPEEDDDAARRAAYEEQNNKANEYLNRRADLADMVSAHLAAAERAGAIGYGRYIVSATSPLLEDDLAELGVDAPAVIERRVPGAKAAYAALGWRLPATLDRVYVNAAARRDLGWQPTYDFARVLGLAEAGKPLVSELAQQVGRKGYHDRVFEDGPYPVE